MGYRQWFNSSGRNFVGMSAGQRNLCQVQTDEAWCETLGCFDGTGNLFEPFVQHLRDFGKYPDNVVDKLGEEVLNIFQRDVFEQPINCWSDDSKRSDQQSQHHRVESQESDGAQDRFPHTCSEPKGKSDRCHLDTYRYPIQALSPLCALDIPKAHFNPLTIVTPDQISLPVRHFDRW